MKKYIPMVVIGIFVLSSLGAVAQYSDNDHIILEKLEEQQILDGRDDYTHTVFAEQCSATWCGHCPPVVGYLDTMYDSGLYDFYYVALVQDRNGYANQRINELNIPGYPTVVFDGGYTRLVGNMGSTGPYINALNICGARTVADIELDLDVYWLGDGNVDVRLEIINNEASDYSGHVHAYVTEIDSRWTVSGHQYHFAMVGNYALNQNINVPASDSSHYNSVWDGSLYGVGDIDPENCMVVVSVFRSGTMHSDETTASMPLSGPDPDQSFVTLTNENMPGLTTCPAGDGSPYEYIKITVKDSNGDPMPDIPSEEFEFTVSDAGAYWFGELSCTFTAADTQTDINGEISFSIVGDTSITGDIQTGDPGYIDIETTVSGITINDVGTLACKSIDYEPDGDVDLVDFVLFAQDYGGNNLRSDFDWDGDVDLVDFVMFAQHYGH